jgi:fatty-acyl-CoA synthase
MACVRPLALHVHQLLNHAARVHGQQVVVSFDAKGQRSTLSYAALAAGAAACAQALRREGIGRGDAVLHLALSSADQIAWLYGAASIGAVTHLLNPLFEPSHALPLALQARPRLLLHDDACLPLARVLLAQAPGVLIRSMADAATLPASAAPLGLDDATLDEQAPALVCYSSGTTGLPKAVQYSHRSLVLHAWACAMTDAMGLSGSDRVLPLMQLFHATAWGAPFVCPMIGATLVLAPPSRDPALWLRCIELERVSVLGAVTAHWAALLAHLEHTGAKPTSLRSTVIGGTRVPPQLAQRIHDTLGIEVRQAWGMTETSPLATMERLEPGGVTLRHGRPVFGLQLEIGSPLAAVDGLPLGELRVRGHWVATPGGEGGWLATGDLATVHEDGRLEVIDRIEDAVLGAGCIVSSALVEANARSVPGVADAALVACAANCSVLAWVHSGSDVPDDDITQALQARLGAAFAGWRPDVLARVDRFPYTPSAKVQKQQLRQTLAAHPNVLARLAFA